MTKRSRIAYYTIGNINLLVTKRVEFHLFSLKIQICFSNRLFPLAVAEG